MVAMTPKRVMLCVALLVFVVACTDGAVDPEACGDTYLRAEIQLADESRHEYCFASAVMNANFLAGLDCTLVGGTIDADDARIRLVLNGGGDWFARTGVAMPISIHANSPDLTCDDPAGNCPFTNYTECRFEVTTPALADGQIIEAHLSEPCTLSGNAGSHGVPPVVVEASFRATLESQQTGDPGIQCHYPFRP